MKVLRPALAVLSVLMLTASLSARQKPGPKMWQIPTAKDKFHVFLLLGQSNMTGFGKMLPEDKAPVPRVVMVPYAGNPGKTTQMGITWRPAAHPLHAGPAGNRFGLGLPFATEYLTTQPDDVVVGLIPAAVGGASIDRLKTGRYPEVVAKAKAAMRHGVIKGVLWHQGESDTTENAKADTYARKLHRFIADLRRDLGNDDLPFIVGNLAEFYGTGKAHGKPDRIQRINQVRKALRSLPGTVNHTGFVESTGCSSPDAHLVHFDRKSYIILGTRYARVYAETVKKAGNDGEAQAKDSSADEPFQKERWPRARTLVWSSPGTSGAMQTMRNWTEYASTADYLARRDGQPATEPPDRNTDIILPDSPDGQSYVVACVERRKGADDALRWDCRHVTVGRGAGLDSGCELRRGRPAYPGVSGLERPMGVYGNVIVRDGGYIYGPRVFLGGKHTYFRAGDSPEPWDRSWTVRKANDASVTLLSEKYDLVEGVTIRSGRLVLASGSRLRFGAGHQGRIGLNKQRDTGTTGQEGYAYVHNEGTLEMRSGSRIGRAREPDATVADLRIEGLLQIGRPGRKCDQPAVIELGMAKGTGGFLTQHGGLYLRPSARVQNFGKLAITTFAPRTKASANKGVSVFLEKPVDLGDVHFDYLRPGGIAAVDLKAAMTSVAGATFGTHCAAKGDDIFSKFDVIDFTGGVGTVEFVDGLKTNCKILFPHAGRLIVRAKGNRTLQSFDLKSVHAVTIADKRTEFSVARPLNDKERKLRQQDALWGDVPGAGQYGKYGKQEWPDCAVMIWARPGTSGASTAGPNWLDEAGRPRFEVPKVSRHRTGSDAIDVLLPAADTRYVAIAVSGRNRGDRMPSYRHFTIEQNACTGLSRTLQGNLWMKHGSGFSGLGAEFHEGGGRFANTKPGVHRFLRFDGKRIPYRQGDCHAALVDGREAAISQYGYFATGDGGTLELIGELRSAADRLSIAGTGTTIISEGSELLDGSRSALWVQHGATLALLQDAFAGTEMTQQRPQCYASMIVGGTLRIGLPDKPIRRDMRFALSGIRKDLVNHSPGLSVRSTGSSFVLGPQGLFAIHSADPKTARVIISMHDSKRALARDADYRAKSPKARDKALWNPEGIVCYFAGRTEIDGVLFDKLYPGGIVVAPDARSKWKNVSYGRNNLAEPEELYRDLTKEGPQEVGPRVKRSHEQ